MNRWAAAAVFTGILLFSAGTLVALGVAVYQSWFTDDYPSALGWLAVGLVFFLLRPVPLLIWKRSRGDRWLS